MDNIKQFLKHNSKFQRLAGPLTAAHVCDTVRALADDRFTVVSFREGLLTLTVESSAAAANLQTELPKLIEEINNKLESKLVEKIRLKIR